MRAEDRKRDHDHRERCKPRGNEKETGRHDRVGRTPERGGQRGHASSPRQESKATARMITMPTAATCHSAGMLKRLSPLRSVATASAPPTVPVSPPRPPTKEVPPSITAAMASNSKPMPIVGWAEFVRAVITKEASAASTAA